MTSVTRELPPSSLQTCLTNIIINLEKEHTLHRHYTFFLRGIQTAENFCLLQNNFRGSVRAKSNRQLKDRVRHIRGNLVTAKRIGVFRIYSNYFKC